MRWTSSVAVVATSIVLMCVAPSCSHAGHNKVPRGITRDRAAALFSGIPELSCGGYKLVIAPVDCRDLLYGYKGDRLKQMAGEGSPLYGKVGYYLFFIGDTIPAECRRHIRMDGLEGHVVAGDVQAADAYGNPSSRLYLVGPGGAVIDSGQPSSMRDRMRLYLRLHPRKTDLGLSVCSVRTADDHLDTTVFIRNYGDVPGVVFETASTCSCTKVRLGGNTIAPGDSVALSVAYEKRKKGDYRSGVTILTNTRGESLQFVIEDIGS